MSIRSPRSGAPPEFQRIERFRRLGLLEHARNCPAWCALFIMSLLLPTECSVYLSNLRLSPYRVLLLIAFFPAAVTLFSGKSGHLRLADILMITFAMWNMVVLGFHHGLAVMAQSGGVQSLELLGAYLVARTSIRTAEHFAGVIVMVMLAVLAVLPFTLYETITGHHAIKQTASALTGGSFSSNIEPRYGFTRAFGPFDHPILWGVFAASSLGMMWFFYQSRQKTTDLLLIALLVVATGTSVSSGAVVSLWMQALLAGYERVTRQIQSRWKIFWVGLAVTYIVLELLSTRSAFIAVTTRISLSSGSAYGRAIIFEYGIQNVWANPIMGLGYNDWTRPQWLHASVDNFWLLTAMTYGIPGFLLFAGACAAVIVSGWRDCHGLTRQLRTGLTITLAGMIVACGTVHLWNNVYVYFTFLIGCGAAFASGLLCTPSKRRRQTTSRRQTPPEPHT